MSEAIAAPAGAPTHNPNSQGCDSTCRHLTTCPYPRVGCAGDRRIAWRSFCKRDRASRHTGNPPGPAVTTCKAVHHHGSIASRMVGRLLQAWVELPAFSEEAVSSRHGPL